MSIEPKDPKKVAAALARAQSLSPGTRSAIASNAAAARWGTRTIRALHKGSFKKEFGVDIDCYVLDDAGKTPVVSQRGMGRALGLSDRGSALPSFLASRMMAAIDGGGELREKMHNPLRFQWGTGGGEQPPTTIHGYDAALLIDLCQAIITAETEKKLPARYTKMAAQARIVVGASAKAGIRGLVYALAGYSPSAEETIAAFKMYVQEEARTYEREFPNELYREWYRLYGIPDLGKGKPWLFRHLTVRHIYFPLAKSNGKILSLMRALKENDGDARKRLFQFLSEIGARALGRHIGRVQEMAESSDTAAIYEMKVNERFGEQRELDLVMPAAPMPALTVSLSRVIAPLPLFERMNSNPVE